MTRTTAERGSARSQDPPRILVMVPHEPDQDPRVRWAIDLCADLCRTDVISWVSLPDRQADKDYDGRVFIDRVNYKAYLQSEEHRREETNVFPFGPHVRAYGMVKKALTLPLLNRLPELLYQRALRNAPPRPSRTGDSRRLGWWKTLQRLALDWREDRAAIDQFIADLQSYSVIVQSLYVRGRSISVVPRVLLCHDIYALFAAVQLKQIHGCPVVYDSHEIWPEAELDSRWWKREFIYHLESRLLRHVDRVITVNPRIARFLEEIYGLKDVVSVPNAEPFRSGNPRSFDREPSLPMRFILQGCASPGRGFDRLLALWCALEEPRAVLQVRAPENPYLAGLRKKYARYVSMGRISFPAAVKEHELVTMASKADVGVIPYPGPSLNHHYACPNKLSQYMQAGLAILHNSDQEFVGEIVQRHGCGLSYDLGDPESLRRAVDHFLHHADNLLEMKRKAHEAARSDYNWQMQSAAYRATLAAFLPGGGEK